MLYNLKFFVRFRSDKVHVCNFLFEFGFDMLVEVDSMVFRYVLKICQITVGVLHCHTKINARVRVGMQIHTCTLFDFLLTQILQLFKGNFLHCIV